MKTLINNLFSSMFDNYKPENFHKYLYIGNLVVLTFIFFIMAIDYDLVGFNGPSGEYRGNNEFFQSTRTIGWSTYHLPWYSFPFYLIYSFILGLSYLCCTLKSNFWTILLGTYVHFNLLVCILFTTFNYDFIYYSSFFYKGPYDSGFLEPIYALPLVLYTLMIITYFIFYFIIPYVIKTYSNSLLGLYLETKKIKLKKLKRKLKDQIKEED